MSDVGRIPQQPVIPPVPQDRAISDREKKQRKNGDEKHHHDEVQSHNNEPTDVEQPNQNSGKGIDYYV